MQIFVREIDAAKFVVFVYVANDVRQLKREAEPFSKVEGTRVAEAEYVRAGEADSAGYAIAIFAEALEGGIGLNR